MDINHAVSNLKRKGYEAKLFRDSEDAKHYLSKELNNKTIGFGDSDTLQTLDLYSVLSKKNRVYDPQNDEGIGFLKTAQACLTTEIFITSVNAASIEGEFVNIDGTGNRIAGSLFGHEKVYFILGTNKFEEDLNAAIYRARNISAPKNAKRLKLKTPCAIDGNKCFNCKSPDRICNGMLIYLDKMDDMDMEVIIIDESLGY